MIYTTERKTCPHCHKEKWLRAFRMLDTDPFADPCAPIVVLLLCRYCETHSTADIPWPMFHVERRYQHLPTRWEDLNHNEVYNYVKNWIDSWFVDDGQQKFVPGIAE